MPTKDKLPMNWEEYKAFRNPNDYEKYSAALSALNKLLLLRDAW
jgi:hypothetical protein